MYTKKLLGNKYQAIFFSPHLDDVTLSCGGFMIRENRKTSFLVVNIFSGGRVNNTHLSRYVKKYLNYCGFRSSEQYFRKRKEEEKIVSAFLGYESLMLDFPEALFRFKKIAPFVCKYFYASRQDLFGCVHLDDDRMGKEIKAKIVEILGNFSSSRTKLFFPLAIGHHVDHQIVHTIAMQLLKEKIVNEARMYFYEDFPYNYWQSCLSSSNIKVEKPTKFRKIRLGKKFLSIKRRAILMYGTQIKPLFRSMENLEELLSEANKNDGEIFWHY